MAAPASGIISNANAAEYAAAVTPSDATALPQITRGLWVGGAGNVSVKMGGDGDTAIFAAVPAGSLLPVRARQVLATGTTATLILALY